MKIDIESRIKIMSEKQQETENTIITMGEHICYLYEIIIDLQIRMTESEKRAKIIINLILACGISIMCVAISIIAILMTSR